MWSITSSGTSLQSESTTSSASTAPTSYNRFAPSRLGAGLAAMLPELLSVDVTDVDAFGAAMRTALDVEGPSVVSV